MQIRAERTNHTAVHYTVRDQLSDGEAESKAEAAEDSWYQPLIAAAGFAFHNCCCCPWMGSPSSKAKWLRCCMWHASYGTQTSSVQEKPLGNNKSCMRNSKEHYKLKIPNQWFLGNWNHGELKQKFCGSIREKGSQHREQDIVTKSFNACSCSSLFYCFCLYHPAIYC